MITSRAMIASEEDVPPQIYSRNCKFAVQEVPETCADKIFLTFHLQAMRHAILFLVLF